MRFGHNSYSQSIGVVDGKPIAPASTQMLDLDTPVVSDRLEMLSQGLLHLILASY